MDKQTVEHPCSGKLLINLKEAIIDHVTAWLSFKNMLHEMRQTQRTQFTDV